MGFKSIWSNVSWTYNIMRIKNVPLLIPLSRLMMTATTLGFCHSPGCLAPILSPHDCIKCCCCCQNNYFFLEYFFAYLISRVIGSISLMCAVEFDDETPFRMSRTASGSVDIVVNGLEDVRVAVISS